MSYQDKVVFVAGGTSGINLGIAEAFARAGARVAVLSRKADKVEAAITHLRSLTPTYWASVPMSVITMPLLPR